MFPYDAALAAAAQASPQSIADVLETMQTIDNICAQGDGLKWFNWLYLQVTQAVENRVAGGGFNDPAWLSELDVQFATLYFNALYASLTGASFPGCWDAMLSVRDQTDIARIQFALAGMNAHINHDLAIAIIGTCRTTGIVPQHGTPQYTDYTGLNGAMDALIDKAKQTLNVRLLGDPLPAVSHLEDTLAAWDLAAAREKAWNTAENLWQSSPALLDMQMDAIDGLTTVIGKILLVAVPK
jgi:Family of unknown function (DUF5995)